MTSAKKLTTRVTAKGQVALPVEIRRRLGWGVGAELTVEERTDGVLLQAKPLFEPTRYEEVFGSANYKGPPISIEEMDAAVQAEVRRRHAVEENGQ
jgi:AbrB family looped-hinge helix DNA binding protein